MQSEKIIIDCAKKASQAYISWIQAFIKLGGADAISCSQFTRLNFILSKDFIKELQKLKKSKKRTYALSSFFKADFHAKKYKNFIKTMKEAQNCCTNQDLHLMQHRQFLIRKGLFSKKIMDWKLLRQVISRKQIDHFHIKTKHSPSIAFKKYLIKRIELQGEGATKTFKEKNNENVRYQNGSRKVYQAEFGGNCSSISVH